MHLHFLSFCYHHQGVFTRILLKYNNWSNFINKKNLNVRVNISSAPHGQKISDFVVPKTNKISVVVQTFR